MNDFPLSRRDLIASMALQGMLAGEHRLLNAEDNAEYALRAADKLIAELGSVDLPPRS